jgi:hypothetical protein
MNALRSELRSKWREAELAGTSDSEWRGVALSVEAPLAILAGIREPDGRIALLLEAPIDAAPRLPLHFRADGVSLADQRRTDEGIFRAAVTLEHDELRDIFEVLAVDLIEVIRSAPTAVKAVSEASRRLDAWQACLRTRRLGLSREEQTGLIGELAVLRLVAAEIGYPLAVDSWEGPLDGIHDFKRLGVALEVKTVVGISQLLHVSHLGQLENTGLDALAIVRARFRETQDGKSVSQVVHEIRDEIRNLAPFALADFEDKLLRVGYLDADSDLYGATRFAPVELHGIMVAEGFPRLTPTSVPAGILDASYIIDERTVAGLRLNTDEFKSLLRRMAGPRL